MISPEEFQNLRAAWAALNEIRSVGDMVYDVRERECLGWEGPKVTAFSEAYREIDKILGGGKE